MQCHIWNETYLLRLQTTIMEGDDETMEGGVLLFEKWRTHFHTEDTEIFCRGDKTNSASRGIIP